MKSRLTVLVACLTVFSGSSIHAQELPQMSAPEKEHKWLEQFVGEWEIQSKGMMGPGQPPIEFAGRMTSRSLGGIWFINELKLEMPGTPMNGIQTIGYDSDKKKYVGTWVDSHMSYMWKYEGTVDESGKKLVLEAEGPNFMVVGKTTSFRDAYEFKSADHIIATSSMLGEDGKWVTFMTGDMHRGEEAKK